MNSSYLLKTILVISSLGIVSTNLLSQPSDAQTPTIKNRVNFYCGEIIEESSGETIPATMAFVPQRKASISVIGWKTHIPAWDAQKRCEAVSPKFESFYKDGRLNYLTIGVNNGYDIICSVVEEGKHCQPEDQLFQVKASSDPEEVLKDLIGIIEGSVSEPIYQSSGNKIYVSMEELLNAAPVVEETDLTAN